MAVDGLLAGEASALENFQAAAHDPGFALAHAGAGICLFLEERFAEARAAPITTGSPVGSGRTETLELASADSLRSRGDGWEAPVIVFQEEADPIFLAIVHEALEYVTDVHLVQYRSGYRPARVERREPWLRFPSFALADPARAGIIDVLSDRAAERGVTMTNRTRPSQVFVGAAKWTSGAIGGLFGQVAGEQHWQRLTKGLPEAVAVQAITVHPADLDVIYVGTDAGPYRSSDGGTNWERLGFPEPREVWSITVHPRDPRVVYAGASPAGVYRSDDGGDRWRRLSRAVQPERLKMSFACRVMRIAVEAGRPDELYAALEVGGVMRSLDSGEHWGDCGADLVKLAERPHLKSRMQSDSEAEGMLDAHAVCVSAAAPGSVFLAVRVGLFRSDDRGSSWRDLEIGRFSPLTYGRDIRVAPHDPRTLYACLSPAARSEDGSLYRSTDLGATWTRVDHGVKARATMMALALHPRDPDQVCCVSRCGQVFGTQDGGRTWGESRLPDGVTDVYAIACA